MLRILRTEKEERERGVNQTIKKGKGSCKLTTNKRE